MKALAPRTEDLWLVISSYLDTFESRNTQRSYMQTLREWLEFLECQPGSEESEAQFLRISEYQVARYRSFLKRRSGMAPRGRSEMTALAKQRIGAVPYTLAPNTVATKLACLKSVYGMLKRRGWIDRNPFDSDSAKIPRKNRSQKLPTEIIPFDKVQDVIAAGKTAEDRALLALLFGGALRVSEALKLQRGDICNLQTEIYIRLRAPKNSGDIEQAIPNWAQDYLREHLESERIPDYREAFIFSMSVRTAARRFKLACRTAGISDWQNKSPHSARATAISKLLFDGSKTYDVKTFARHDSILTTEQYDKRIQRVENSVAQKLNFDLEPKKSRL